MKKCLKCQCIKEIVNFHKDRSQKDGINKICKECVSVKNKKRYGPKPDKPQNAGVETLEQFLARGGQIKKVDFSNAYGKCRPRFIDWNKRKKKTELDRKIEFDANSLRFK